MSSPWAAAPCSAGGSRLLSRHLRRRLVLGRRTPCSLWKSLEPLAASTSPLSAPRVAALLGRHRAVGGRLRSAVDRPQQAAQTRRGRARPRVGVRLVEALLDLRRDDGGLRVLLRAASKSASTSPLSSVPERSASACSKRRSRSRAIAAVGDGQPRAQEGALSKPAPACRRRRGRCASSARRSSRSASASAAASRRSTTA